MPNNIKRLTLLPSAARTTSSNALASAAETPAGTIPILGRFDRALLLLDVTAAATAAGDTLDVYVQKNVNPLSATAVWTDFVHFTQVLGNGGAKQFVAEIGAAELTDAPLHPVQDAAMAVGVNQGPWSDDWRVKWVVVSASAPSFTFALYGSFWGSL